MRGDDLLVLGIESTAHTFGVGIATSSGRILADARSTYKPPPGEGIKPVEAAEHHSRVAGEVLREALDEAGVGLGEIDGVAVSLGPGMGPCLRVGASVARFLALKLGKPLIPVNHAVAHIEIARLTTGLEDPVVVYVSGGNTMVTTFVGGRYRVFGETLDISLGNCLDTFAREVGLGFPGVPKVEELASRGNVLLDFPYLVKGQDLSYSGLLTYALRVLREGARIEDVAYTLVEYTYTMLVEVAERAMAHTGKAELTITGGVARSEKLSRKLEDMAEERGASFRPVEPRYAGDNGAMIAYTGALAMSSGVSLPVERSAIRPLWRIDKVDIPWRREVGRKSGETFVPRLKLPVSLSRVEPIALGAEAALFEGFLAGEHVVEKYRLSKGYRLPELDRRLRRRRTALEARVLARAVEAGVDVPGIVYVSPEDAVIIEEYVEGRRLKEILSEEGLSEYVESVLKALGRSVARLHVSGVVHGDLTTSNVVVHDGRPVLIDFGLSEFRRDIEARAVDLHLFLRSLESTHPWYSDAAFGRFADGYSEVVGRENLERILERVREIRMRGRFVEERRRGVWG